MSPPSRLTWAPLAVILAFAACAVDFDDGDGLPPGDDDIADDDTGDDDTTASSDDDISTSPPGDHFCGDPLLGGAAQAAWASLFAVGATPDDTLGPGVVYPQQDTRYPGNWPAPGWSWLAGGGGANLFWLEVEVPNESCTLRVLTTDAGWTPDDTTWARLRAVIPGELSSLSVTGAQIDLGTGALLSGPWKATVPRTFTPLPFTAPGRIVYWTTLDGSLQQVQLGTTYPTLLYGPANNGGYCVGCHAGTPDGHYLGATVVLASGTGYGIDVLRTADLTDYPSTSPTSQGVLDTADSGYTAFSTAYWNDADPRVIHYQNGHLISVGLVSGVVTTLTASGDGGTATEPTWSPDGQEVVYVSSLSPGTGLAYDTSGLDLWRMPYGDGFGGGASKVVGADDPSWNEYFPQFSPDGRWLVFNRTDGYTINSVNAEVWLIPASGGTPLRLAANDAAPELNQVSPGITNSMPRWAPAWQETGGDRWYLLTFSSTRHHGYPQAWVAPLKVDSAGTVTSYPALYLIGQDLASNNHIPVWFGSDL